MNSYLSVFAKRFSSDPASNPISTGGVGDLVSAHPNMIKILDGEDQARWAVQNDLSIIVNFRSIAALEDLAQGKTPSAAYAAEYWKAIKPTLERITAGLDKKRFIFCMWPNEPNVDDASLRQLNEFFAALAELAGQAGYVISGPGFSAETRIWQDKWKLLLDMFRAFRKWGHYLDLHGYAANFNDSRLQEFLYPWRPLRAAMASSGELLPAILCGEGPSVDDNIAYGIVLPGYREKYSNEAYAAWLIAAGAELAKDRVNGFVFWASFADDDQFMQYNINIGSAQTHSKPADPSVWDRIRPWIVAQQAIIEIPAPPPITPPADPGPVTPPAFPAWYRVNTGTDRLRKRLAPVDGQIVELQVSGSELLIESITNGWAKEVGAGLYASAQYLVKK